MEQKNNSQFDVWNENWGSKYNINRKKQFKKILIELSKKNILGKNVVDVGCGNSPLISCLPNNKYKKIYLDISKGIENKINDSNNLFVKIDLNNIFTDNQNDFKKYLKKIYQFLGEEEITNYSNFKKKINYADTIIFSDVINYINYRDIFKKFYSFLKKDGRKIIFNKINMGFYHLFSQQRPKSNWELLKFLQLDLKMVIEYQRLVPLVLGDDIEPEQATFIIVAKKKLCNVLS